jgi:hypothetical protein
MVRRSPDRPISAAEEVLSRLFQLFSTQFLHALV